MDTFIQSQLVPEVVLPTSDEGVEIVLGEVDEDTPSTSKPLQTLVQLHTPDDTLYMTFDIASTGRYTGDERLYIFLYKSNHPSATKVTIVRYDLANGDQSIRNFEHVIIRRKERGKISFQQLLKIGQISLDIIEIASKSIKISTDLNTINIIEEK